MKKCKYCAEEIQDEAIKCKHCGKGQKISALTILGNCWALFGVVNILMLIIAASNGGSSNVATTGLLLSSIVFIVPGLTLAHIGKR